MYHGVTNIGYKPTVDGSFLGVETYLYEFHQEIYGKGSDCRAAALQPAGAEV